MVKGLKAYSDGLYAAGWFNTVDDTIEANGLARWDGAQWHAVHDLPQLAIGNNNLVNDVAIYQGEVYIGGNFAGTNGRNDIAKWNGADWVSLDGQGFLGVFSSVNKLKVHDGLLYVAGSFADHPPYGNPGNPGSGILTWDGSNWGDLDGGTDGASNASVLDMVWIHDTLYALGRFNMIGGVPSGRIARWDGIQWCSLTPPDYFSSSVSGFGTYGDVLHVGGTFTVAGTDSINRVARWIGGSYVDSCGFGVGISEPNPFELLDLLYNPATATLTMPSSHQYGAVMLQLQLFDPLGRVVLVRNVRSGDLVSIATLRPGVYLARVSDPNTVLGAQRFVKPN